MILINKNSSNTFVVTLKEKTTISSPTYLFKFKSGISNEVVLFLSTDLSEYKDRYNKFSITETSGTVDPPNGIVELSPTGYWSYTVFEQVSTTNLIEANTGAVVETGKVKVVGTEMTLAVFDPPEKTYKSYGKGSTE